MGSLTVQENQSSSYKSTWVVTATAPNVVASDSTFNLGTLSATAKYTYSGKNIAYETSQIVAYIGSTSIGSVYAGYPSSAEAPLVGSTWATGTTKTLRTSSDGISGITLNTSQLFSSTNSTSTTANITIKSQNNNFYSATKSSSGTISQANHYTNTSAVSMGTLCTVTLDAPPTFTTTQVSFNTAYVYAGYTTASVTISNLSAKYGGSITSAVLTIGNQTASRSTNGSLSIALNAGGTFTPTVTVTDSRGQVTTQSLDPITVKVYANPSASYTAERTGSTGVPNDEGTYAVISTTLTYASDMATLQAPTVGVEDDNGTAITPTVTWYTTRASSGVVSGSVTWANVASGSTVYGLVSITGGFNTQKSYAITVTPKDNRGTGTAITQTLATAFYTVDFLAGGHGIAFGQSASQTGFWCNMETHLLQDAYFGSSAYFTDHNSVVRALFDFIYPVGSYYETSDTTFDPNTSWGGTWSLEAEGLVHIGAGSTYTAGSTGGESQHTLIESELPNITGSFDIRPWYSGSTDGATQVNAQGVFGRESGSAQTGVQTSGRSATSFKTTLSFGSGNAHNNMQPYIVVNRWHRTA